MADVYSHAVGGSNTSHDSNTYSLEMSLLSNDYQNNTSSNKGRKNSSNRSLMQWQTIPLKHLTLGERLGMGAYGIVYHGVYQGNTVAIKEVNRGETRDREACASVCVECVVLCYMLLACYYDHDS